MEENVALDSTKQKKFVKSLKGIKKLIKKNKKDEVKSGSQKKNEQVKPEKPFSMRLKDGTTRKKKKKPFQRGLVYLGHIPHGFYEHQLTQYCKQFGMVTNARVIRSKHTGNSKGYAFVEFREASVAQIVADTMNNYLMGKRLIKAAYIPSEKIRRRAFRKKWNPVNNPTNLRRTKLNKEFNADKDDKGDLKKAKKLLANLNKTKKRLSEMGINYDFFKPVDIPMELLHSVFKTEKLQDEVKLEDESNSKIDKKKVKEQKTEKIIKNEKQNIDNKTIKKNKNTDKISKTVEVEVKQGANNKTITDKKGKNQTNVNEKLQIEKLNKLKEAGVKPLEEFISLDAEDHDESDEYEFDSDEYEKMLEGSDDSIDENESDESGDESETDDDEQSNKEEESEDEADESDDVKMPVLKPKLVTANKVVPPLQKTNKANQLKQEPKKAQDFKRKVPRKQPLAAKKSKFEKQTQSKPLKKQFKKK